MSKSILIASPNTDLGELLRLSLEESSEYDIRMARSPGAVWEIMNSVRINLVILDTDLIEKELSLFVQNLLEKQSSLRYLIIPPQNNPQHPTLAGLYPDGYVTRPFFIADVITHIERLIGAALETPEPEVEEEPAPIEEITPELESPFEEKILESFLEDDIEDTQPTIWNADQPTTLLLEEIVPLPVEETPAENTSLDGFEAIFLDDFLFEEEVVEEEPQQEITPDVELSTPAPSEEPQQEIPSEVELSTPAPFEEPPISTPVNALQTEQVFSAEEGIAIPLASLPPLEPELPPAPLDLALSMPVAIKSLHLEPEYLAALQQEVDACACLVCDAAGVYSYSGELNSEDGRQIAAVLRHHIEFDVQSGLAHFLNIGKPPLETLLYAINLIDQCLLVVLYDVNTPISRAHTLTGNVRRRLLGEPAPNPEESPVEQAVETETHTVLVELLAMMPPPQPEELPTPDEILSEQPTVEESIELPDWAIPQPHLAEPETTSPEVEMEIQPEPVSVPEIKEEPVELELPDWAILQPHATDSAQEPQPLPAMEPPVVEKPLTAELEAVQETIEPQPEPVTNPIIDNIVFPWDMETNSPVYDAVVNVEPADAGAETDHSNPQAHAGSAQTDQAFSCVLVPARSEHLLTGDASKHLNRWMPELCTSFGWQMTSLTIQPEYMLWSIVVPPTVPTGSLVNRIREYTSQKIMETIPQFGASHSPDDFWAPTSLTVRGEHLPSQKAIDDLIQQARRRRQPASTT